MVYKIIYKNVEYLVIYNGESTDGDLQLLIGDYTFFLEEDHPNHIAVKKHFNEEILPSIEITEVLSKDIDLKNE